MSNETCLSCKHPKEAHLHWSNKCSMCIDINIDAIRKSGSFNNIQGILMRSTYEHEEAIKCSCKEFMDNLGYLERLSDE